MVIILAGGQDNVLEVYEVQICDFREDGRTYTLTARNIYIDSDRVHWYHRVQCL